MFRRVFTSAVLLLLVVLMCCTCGGASAEDKPAKNVDPFAGTTRISSANWEERQCDMEVVSFRVPSLVRVKKDVFAIAGAQCKGSDGVSSWTGVVSKHLKEGDAGSTEILTGDKSLFGVHVLKGVATHANEATEMLRPTTLVIDDSVYMLFGNYSMTALGAQTAGAGGWGFFLVKGTVIGGDGNKKLQWSETHEVKPDARRWLRVWAGVVSGGGSGVVMRDGTPAFSLQATYKNGKSALLSMRFDSEKQWGLSFEDIGAGCRNPSLVEWEETGGTRLFVMGSCDKGYYDVYDTTLGGAAWYGPVQSITRVWGTSHDRRGNGVQSGFTAAVIGDRQVMLVTTPVYPEEREGHEDGQNGRKGRLHLWVTDNTHVYDIGPVSREDDDAAGSSLLYDSDKGGELILLYENKESEDSYSLVSVRLTEQIERVKEVVKTWKGLDRALYACSSTDTVDARRRGMCKRPVPIEGLAGFLSGTFTGGQWVDEYRGVNATVHGTVDMLSNGVTFQGAGSWAEWPVGKLGQNVPYYFTNNRFTLVATVTIHKVPERGGVPIPLMGVKMNDTANTMLFGLSYTHDRRWRSTLHGKGDDDGDNQWLANRTHQVVVKMEVNDWTVYVDGTEIYDETYGGRLFDSHRISHLYFGALGKGGAESSHVTVTNVLLYNRLLKTAEIRKLNANRAPILRPGAEQSVPVPGVSGTPSGELDTFSDEELEDSVSPEASPVAEYEEDSVGDDGGDGLAPGVSERPNAEASAGPKDVTVAVARNVSTREVEEPRIPTVNTTPEDNQPQEREKELTQQGGTAEKLTPRSEEAPEVSADAAVLQVDDSSKTGETAKKTRLDPEQAPKAGMDPPSRSEEGTLQQGATEHHAQESPAPSVGNEALLPNGSAAPVEKKNPGAETNVAVSDTAVGPDINSDSNTGAVAASTKDTANVSQPETAHVSVQDGEEVSQEVDATPAKTSTTPGSEETSSAPKAAEASGDNSGDFENITESVAKDAGGDGTVHGCMSRVLLPFLLGLWGVTILC